MHYSLHGSRPAPLPFRITLPSGFTRTDPSTFTVEEIIAAGFTGPYSEPTYDSNTEQLEWVDGDYVIEALPPPPVVPRWVDFSSAIMALPAVNQMLGAILQSAPGLYGGLVIGLQRASEGDSVVFLNSWGAAKGMTLISNKLIESVQALGSEYDLPQEFVAALGDPEPELIRARNPDGTFIADDPTTPNNDEAWVTS